MERILVHKIEILGGEELTKYEKERDDGSCFLPEKNNPYPLCAGKDREECEDCQRRADWEPDDPYGVGI